MNAFEFNSLVIGMEESFSITFDEALIRSFAKASGDENPLHVNLDYCREMNHPSLVAHGCLVATYLSRFVGMHLPGKYSKFLSMKVSWMIPVFAGDRITYKGKVTGLSPGTKVCEIDVNGFNQNERKAFKSQLMVQLLK